MSNRLAALKDQVRGYLATYQAEHTHPLCKLTHYVGIPMIVTSLPVALVSPLTGLGMFTGGWVLQFVGHYVFEKNQPAFFANPLYLLVGALWVVLELLSLVGVPLPEGLAPSAAR
jgi:uncharacterized membrane protein YGL010W